jgi:hypothetical protein
MASGRGALSSRSCEPTQLYHYNHVLRLSLWLERVVLVWSKFYSFRVASVMFSQHKHDGGVDENNIDSTTNQKYIFSPCLCVMQ